MEKNRPFRKQEGFSKRHFHQSIIGRSANLRMRRSRWVGLLRCSVCLSVCLSVDLSVRLSVCQSVSQSVSQPVSKSISHPRQSFCPYENDSSRQEVKKDWRQLGLFSYIYIYIASKTTTKNHSRSQYTRCLKPISMHSELFSRFSLICFIYLY